MRNASGNNQPCGFRINTVSDRQHASRSALSQRTRRFEARRPSLVSVANRAAKTRCDFRAADLAIDLSYAAGPTRVEITFGNSLLFLCVLGALRGRIAPHSLYRKVRKGTQQGKANLLSVPAYGLNRRLQSSHA
jgi:hypothetical protein